VIEMAATAHRKDGLAMLIVVLVLGTIICGASGLSIGDRLLRDYTVYDSIPITATEAKSEGWTIQGTCDPNRGYKASFSASGPTESNPIALFFTAAGQVAGIGVNVYGQVKQSLVNQGYFEVVDAANQIYFIAVSFRNASMMCSGAQSNDTLGDTLIINAGKLSRPIPLTEKDTTMGNWTRGSCFYSMGYHWFYDLSSAPVMSWQAANMLPIVPMYSNGVINAFFFASSVVQQGLFYANWWDSIPLLDFLMCKNWCDSSCTFHDTSAWSTMHIYLRDYTKATCPGGCTISCCPK